MTVDFHSHPIMQEFREGLEVLGIDPIVEDGFTYLNGRLKSIWNLWNRRE